MKFRHATSADLDHIEAIILQARADFARAGSDQWQNGYPDRTDITEDISAKTGYVLIDDGKTMNNVAGYMNVSFASDPDYAATQGVWNTCEPYCVIHRIMMHDEYKGKGLAQAFFEYAEELCKTNGIGGIRVDTHVKNAKMRALLKSRGFAECGITKVHGSERLIFDKIIAD